MTPNGPTPGQPSQPWSAGGSDEEYQQPADPWGDQNEAWAGDATTTPGLGSASDFGLTGTGFGPQYAAPETSMTGAPTGMGLGWVSPPAPPRRSGPGTPIVALVVVLGLLICGGLSATTWLLFKTKDADKSAAAASSPTVVSPPAAAATDPQPTNGQDARFVAKGQCVRNEGTADTPRMTIVQCSTGTYEVLARVDGRTTGEADAETKCAKVKHYTKWYFYDSELDSLDFVLCLRESA
jgi:hypothetical protein